MLRCKKKAKFDRITPILSCLSLTLGLLYNLAGYPFTRTKHDSNQKTTTTTYQFCTITSYFFVRFFKKSSQIPVLSSGVGISGLIPCNLLCFAIFFCRGKKNHSHHLSDVTTHQNFILPTCATQFLWVMLLTVMAFR